VLYRIPIKLQIFQNIEKLQFKLYPGRGYCALKNLTMDRKIDKNTVKAAIPYFKRIFSDKRFVDKDNDFIISTKIRIA
jgi:hypothetical protein